MLWKKTLLKRSNLWFFCMGIVVWTKQIHYSQDSSNTHEINCMLFSDLLCFIVDTERRHHISITKKPKAFINNTKKLSCSPQIMIFFFFNVGPFRDDWKYHGWNKNSMNSTQYSTTLWKTENICTKSIWITNCASHLMVCTSKSISNHLKVNSTVICESQWIIISIEISIMDSTVSWIHHS